MKPYPKYKDSGVDWIGKIPEHWEITKFKYLYKSNMGATLLRSDLDEDGKIPVYSATESDDIFGYVNNSNVILEPGDLVIPARGNSIGYVTMVKELATCTQTTIYSKKITDDFNKKYIFHYLRGLKEFLFQFDRTAIPQVTVGEVKENPIVLPPPGKQTAIANYIDHKTSLIDSLIEKKRKLIELLKEERKADINRAVTKGLDPNVPMEDSGIEWLGNIPQHWDVKKLRFLGELQNGISKNSDSFGSGYPFLGYGSIYDNEITPKKAEGLVNSTEAEREKYSVKEGDVFFTRTSETMEEIGIPCTCMATIENCVFSGFVIRFRNTSKLLTKGFSRYYFQSHFPRVFLVNEMNIVTRSSLSQGLLKRLPVLLPPLDEQQQLVEYLDNQTKKIHSFIEKANKMIDLLNEYRTALISEAVTGKIDVREDKI